MAETTIIQLIINVIMTLVIALTTPCPTEDSHNCYHSNDNNQGYSFIAINLTNDDNDDALIIPLP